MAEYCSQVDANAKVLQVIVADAAHCASRGAGWVPGFGHRDGTYDNILKVFIPVKPFPSWTLDTGKLQWKPPKPMPLNVPADKDIPVWDEVKQDWVDPKTGVIYVPAPIKVKP